MSERNARVAVAAIFFLYVLYIRVYDVADTFLMLGEQTRDWSVALGGLTDLPLTGAPSTAGGRAQPSEVRAQDDALAAADDEARDPPGDADAGGENAPWRGHATRGGAVGARRRSLAGRSEAARGSAVGAPRRRLTGPGHGAQVGAPPRRLTGPGHAARGRRLARPGLASGGGR